MKNLKDKLSSVVNQTDVLFDPLTPAQMKRVLGGSADEAFASGETKTASGQKCDGVAVCNCNCVPPGPIKTT